MEVTPDIKLHYGLEVPSASALGQLGKKKRLLALPNRGVSGTQVA